MLWVLIRIAYECCYGEISNGYPQHMFLWRNNENYPSVVPTQPPYLFHSINWQDIWASSRENQHYGMCAQRRLRSAWASAQFDQSLRSALNGVAKDPRFLHADSEDPDQTGRMPRLIWVFAGRPNHFVGFVMRRLISYPYWWVFNFWIWVLPGHFDAE